MREQTEMSLPSEAHDLTLKCAQRAAERIFTLLQHHEDSESVTPLDDSVKISMSGGRVDTSSLLLAKVTLGSTPEPIYLRIEISVKLLSQSQLRGEASFGSSAFYRELGTENATTPAPDSPDTSSARARHERLSSSNL